MTITTAMIKELRERTGAGMMDCKKILTETEGNIELAIDELRKKGAAAAEKKAGRIAADGIIVCAGNDSFGVILEVNSETDFVAKDDSFKKFAADVADAVLNSDATDVEALGSVSVAGGTVEDARQELITRIGENISIRRFEKIAVGEGPHERSLSVQVLEHCRKSRSLHGYSRLCLVACWGEGGSPCPQPAVW